MERKGALVLWNALCLAKEMWTRGVRDGEAFRKRMRELIDDEELARIDYVSVADPETLQEVDRIHGPVLVSLAVRIGKTRLIDNVTLGIANVGTEL
jgi:pantoate--beta-alanine ligase